MKVILKKINDLVLGNKVTLLQKESQNAIGAFKSAVNNLEAVNIKIAEASEEKYVAIAKQQAIIDNLKGDIATLTSAGIANSKIISKINEFFFN